MKRLICLIKFSAFSFSLMSPAHPAQAQQLSFQPFRETGIYAPGERAGWTVALTPDSAATVGECGYVIRKNNSDILQKGVLDLSSGRATIETRLDEPAMLYVEVVLSPPVSPGQDSPTPGVTPQSRTAGPGKC